ncbi:DNA-binding transcriptional regulator, XRE-family HTH domain [Hathewaya proteolytica DSM 3090]|uniref:DNA-binding transcriptional regulator, XRE-family HTH domain n=1 Tax=Hathewaya proteolytica DSM 3090 TaxID=1121331 RepID=A0A1M6QLE3_9CLOT|nr:helix-turn-helix transcriptional regulator [Hathewaya proteolytica]SHK21046.1 DNA-binding transcriptional regulator, XRE-family HTH domain [Hathewaya proteolytica DSM 3090]
MQFKDKLRKMRTENKMTQEELSNKLGVTKRTLINYEKGNCYPKSTEIFSKLSSIFNVSTDYLMMDESENINSNEKSIEMDSKLQAMNLISEVSALFSGGNLEEGDKDAVMQALMEAYLDAKKNGEQHHENIFTKS